jgi:hypothetical protein
VSGRFRGMRAAAAMVAVAAYLVAGVDGGGAASARPVARAQLPTTLWAAPDGTGAACSQGAPCSLPAAQTAARGLSTNLHRDLVVALEDGTYSLDQTLRFGPADSGTNGYTVHYQAAPGAHPVLSGGVPITGWTKVAGTANTWTASVPAGFDTRQLYVDGRSMPLSTGAPPTQFLQTANGFTTATPALAGWRHPTNISVVFTGGNGAWTVTSCPIASVAGTTVDVAQPCWKNLHLGPGLGLQQAAWLLGPWGGFGGLFPLKYPTSLENAYELLTPGHWSIDRASHQVFFMAPPGFDVSHASVVAPALQTLVDVRGTLDQPVHDLALRGLQFSYGTWLQPSTNDGFAQMQADWTLTGPNGSTNEGTCTYSTPAGSCPFGSWTRTPANVVLSATRDVTIEGNTFTHLGGAGLDVMYGSQRDLVRGNEFTDIAASAIQLGSTDDALPSWVGADDREINADDTITDNYVHDVATQYLGGIGIWVGYARRAQITHNQVSEVPYTAISFGWGGWHTNWTAPGANPNVNAGNVIADNLLFDYMQVLGDGGAIYTNGAQARNFDDRLRLTGNVSYGGANTDFTYYTDAGSQYIEVAGNVAFDEPVDSFSSGGCHTVGHIRLNGNYFAGIAPLYPCAPSTDVVTTGTKLVCTDLAPGQVPDAVLANAGLEPAYRGLLARGAPTVSAVGPRSISTSAAPVLVSGTGFDAGSIVWFGGTPASSVTVLSANELIATAPPGASGKVDVTVTTAAGTSAPHAADQVTRSPLHAACLPLVGGPFSTALIS